VQTHCNQRPAFQSVVKACAAGVFYVSVSLDASFLDVRSPSAKASALASYFTNSLKDSGADHV